MSVTERVLQLMSKNKKQGIALMLIGAAAVGIALIMVIANIISEKKAGESLIVAQQLLSYEVSLQEEKTTVKNEIPDYILNPQKELPTRVIDGEKYIGRLSLHTLELNLPVISELDSEKLEYAPCRYKGSPYSDDFIIGAHNYVSHFSRIDELSGGDKITFTDAEGNSFEYEVTGLEYLEDTDIRLMESGDWDLTLFTCTYDSQRRITVRAKRIRQEIMYGN